MEPPTRTWLTPFSKKFGKLLASEFGTIVSNDSLWN